MEFLQHYRPHPPPLRQHNKKVEKQNNNNNTKTSKTAIKPKQVAQYNSVSNTKTKNTTKIIATILSKYMVLVFAIVSKLEDTTKLIKFGNSCMLEKA